MTIPRRQVRQITSLYAKNVEVVTAVHRHVNAPTADERHGAIVVRMQEDFLRIGQRARDELVAIDAADAAAKRRP